ncbi:glycosyltransferase family 9 protein [Salinibacterium sp. ZJ454]|uniref:glycosyltransferase family 9 protein n=1 Tax=Salinibacterium sp. ZJ454 TaxID=2708339 RepID=UPI0014221E39|nr:glycosyltransferase family 9 protein [Salinibacterium sp. ZJ454]
MELFDQNHPGPTLLALRALKLGDLLVAVPALHALRRSNPEHRIVAAVPGWLAPIVQLVPGVDALLPTPGLDDPLPLAAGSIDTVVNLHGNGAQSRGLLDALGACRRIGHEGGGWRGPVWLDGIHERVRWARLVESHGMPADPADLAISRPEVPSPAAGATVVHVGAFYGSRRWPVERFARVVDALQHDGRQVVLSGSEAERPRAEDVADAAGLPHSQVLAGELQLDAFAALVSEASLVISADTGAAHLASAYGTPSVVLFGPAPASEWGPPAGGPHIVLTDASQRRGDTFSSVPDPALLAVSVADVLAATQTLLSERSSASGSRARLPAPSPSRLDD